MGIIFMRGCESFGEKVAYYLAQWNHPTYEMQIKITCPRFATGEGKGLILESVRGKDIFIIADPFNYSVEYKMYDKVVPMSPDDHFQDIKRILCAIGGKAKRITVIMPMLYEGRQHRRAHRESLDCAIALQELVNMGVSNIITFDAHDQRVQNAIPLCGFDNMQPRYQMIKAIVRNIPDIRFDKEHLVMISPDEGGINRALEYSSVLNVEVGMFYKRRNVDVIVDGTNPIEYHEYLGCDVYEKDVIIVDDMISSGTSLIDTFRILKERGAKRIFAFISFGLFCNGYAHFDTAYNNGLFDKIFVTNLIYNPQELLEKPWLVNVDLSKYVAYVIDAIYHDLSVAAIIDPNTKILKLIGQIKEQKDSPKE